MNFIVGLRNAVEYAARSGVILALETMENDFMNTSQKALDVVEKISSPYLQIYPDVGNVSNGTHDPIGDIKCACGYIAAAHLKETKPGVFRDLEYGEGQVDFQGCITELMKQGVGIFNCEFWYDKKTEPSEYISRNYDYICKCFFKAGIEL